MEAVLIITLGVLWSGMMYVIGMENGEAKHINRDNEAVDRFEVIDHRQCVWCRGRAVANFLQPDGSYKEQPCDRCDGSGISGGRVYTVSSNPERSMIKVQLSYQDDGKTLKVFVSDKEKQL